ncbi:hypothetical protein [Streptomyces sp. NPDC127114]|uniref:hypothetical protein n=1 Tax=Streptomyces sp. NPDC127114 TaxID=3345366 RepID=UPI003645BAB9
MTQTSAPISVGPAFESVPAWLSADAAAWAGARPGWWARPLWSVLALLASVAAAIGLEPMAVCSEAAPCGPDWVGMVQFGLAVGMPYWFARLPELALVAAPVLAVIVAWEELPATGWASRSANLAVIAALGLGWAAARARLAARRRQRDLVRQAGAAAVGHGWVKSTGAAPGRGRRGLVPIAVGALLCAVAVGAVVLGLRGVGEDERQAARATRTEAVVTGRTDMTLKVRTHDGRRLTVDALFPEDYRLESTVVVLEDGPWRRLAAEPYDAFDRQLAALAAGLPGLSLLTTGLLARRRAAALRRGEVPALRVLKRWDRKGRSWVYAADDTAGRRPLFSCVCLPVSTGAGEHGKAGGVDDLDDVDEADDVDTADVCTVDGRVPFPAAGLREAVMVGAPYEGGELAFVMTGGGAEASVVDCTVGPVRVP